MKLVRVLAVFALFSTAPAILAQSTYRAVLESYEVSANSFCNSSQREDPIRDQLRQTGVVTLTRTCGGTSTTATLTVVAPAVIEGARLTRPNDRTYAFEQPITISATLTNVYSYPEARGSFNVIGLSIRDTPNVGWKGTCPDGVRRDQAFTGSATVTVALPDCRRSPEHSTDIINGVERFKIWTTGSAAPFSATGQNAPSPQVNLEVEAVYRVERQQVPVPAAPRPQPPTDSRVVVETGAGLKTACTKRLDGPLRITVPVDRVVGALDNEGFLFSPRLGTVVSTNVTLRIAVYHESLGGSTAPPRDRFRMNGRDPVQDTPTFLTGPSGVWTVNTVSFPSLVTRFGRRVPSQPPGNPPDPGKNEIEIQVNPNPSGVVAPEEWCTVIDWVELSFDAIYPVIFVHGNGQGDDARGGDFWKGGVLGDRTEPRLPMRFNVLDSFDEAGIPYDSSISMFTNTTEQHGDILGKVIPAIAKEFGARHVHLVAHSKGGLDSRDFMARTVPPNFGILSFTTFSSPHQGSSGPDYQVDAVHANLANSDDSTHTAIAALSPPGPGTNSLRVGTVALFNLKNIPLMPRTMTVDGETKPVKYTNVVADANLDDSFSLAGNPTISFDETEGLPGQPGAMPNSAWATVVEQLYRILGNVAYTYVSTKQIQTQQDSKIVYINVPVVKEVPTQTFQPNDFCVTWPSGSYLARQMGGRIETLKANHSTVAGPISAKIAIETILSSQPMQ